MGPQGLATAQPGSPGRVARQALPRPPGAEEAVRVEAWPKVGRGGTAGGHWGPLSVDAPDSTQWLHLCSPATSTPTLHGDKRASFRPEALVWMDLPNHPGRTIEDALGC